MLHILQLFCEILPGSEQIIILESDGKDLYMVRKTNTQIVKELRGGKGEVEIQHIVSKEEFSLKVTVLVESLDVNGISISFSTKL